jgi:predicted SAM-dependent methyltransferase
MTNENGKICLNLGAGAVRIDGYTAVDRKTGQEVYPLACVDNSVDEIYASHVLEHFSHNEVFNVLGDWARVLKPGGRMRVAVPNFDWIAEHYRAGEPINTQGYVMGGHVDPDDRHGAIFDYELLSELLANAGMERIGHFDPEYQDCTRLPVSLNVVAYKPASSLRTVEKTVAVLSAPRYGPVMHFRIVDAALHDLHIPYYMGQGAFWHLILSELLEELLTTGAQYIITIDYDTICGAEEFLELYRLAQAFPQADAICGVQMKRGGDHSLFTVKDAAGLPQNKAWMADFKRHLTPVTTAHFGLTLLRASALDSIPRPWMVGRPNEAGRWDEGKVDPDIEFWYHWKEAGKTLYMANNVLVGHLSEAILWPDERHNGVWQEPKDYIEHGIPPAVRRTRTGGA